ncbi:MAG: hypothetical protein QXH26_02530 [Candidatus Hadarchaeales archaeon]
MTTQLLRLLRERGGKLGLKARTISKIWDPAPVPEVLTKLRSLERRGLVRKKGNHWIALPPRTRKEGGKSIFFGLKQL